MYLNCFFWECFIFDGFIRPPSVHNQREPLLDTHRNYFFPDDDDTFGFMYISIQWQILEKEKSIFLTRRWRRHIACIGLISQCFRCCCFFFFFLLLPTATTCSKANATRGRSRMHSLKTKYQEKKLLDFKHILNKTQDKKILHHRKTFCYHRNLVLFAVVSAMEKIYWLTAPANILEIKIYRENVLFGSLMWCRLFSAGKSYLFSFFSNAKRTILSPPKTKPKQYQREYRAKYIEANL